MHADYVRSRSKLQGNDERPRLKKGRRDPSQPPNDSLPPGHADRGILFVRLERPHRNLPMSSLAPDKRSKVAILLRKMSGQHGRLDGSRTPETLPAGASLSLISAERDGYSAGAASPPLDDSLPP